MAATHYDAIVIGSGQSGVPLAAALASAGRRTAIVERASRLGGTCVNEGCTPTKTMIASGRVAYLARRAADYGVHPGGADETGAAVRVDMARVRQRKRDIVTSFSSGSLRRLSNAGVDVLWGAARFTGPKTLVVAMREGGEERTVDAETVFLNVGERPMRPDIPGLDEVEPARVLNSTSVMELGEVPVHLLVLGGGPIGLEFGQLFRRLGAKVTVVQRAAKLVPREDEDVSDEMLKILREDGIEVHLGAAATGIAAHGEGDEPIALTIRTGQGDGGAETTIAASHVLLATGRVPNTDAELGLAAAGIKTDKRGHVVVDDKLQTSAPGVYALGDCHGGPAFTHMSYDDFRIVRAQLLPSAGTTAAAREMKTTEVSRSRNLVPSVTYTDPQLAHVGLHERQLRAAGRKIKVAKMPMSYVARALETDETRGLMKASVDAETGEILGFTCLGLEGGEIMAVVQTAMMGGLKWWDLEAAVWAHPSLAEALNNLWGFLE